jgi:protein phosphatase
VVSGQPARVDVIGDVHGCFDELVELLGRLFGLRRSRADDIHELAAAIGASGRRVVFVGDLVNRGLRPAAVLRLVMGLCEAGVGAAVLGNHDDQLRWALHGRAVEQTPELVQTLRALALEPYAFAQDVARFYDGLPAQVVFDRGQVLVSHAGLPLELHGRTSTTAFERAVYGPTTGERDGYGFPVRLKPTPVDWAEAYDGEAVVVHGHKAIAAPRWIGRTLNIDSNCSRGGALTAWRYPERELVSVAARAVYWAASEG